LRSRPMATRLIDAEANLWFFTNEYSDKVSEILNERNINLSYSLPGKHKYVSISGRAELVHDREKMKELWNPVLKAWFPEGLEDADLALLKVKILQGEYWDAEASKMKQFVQIAKSIMTGSTYDAGEHGHFDAAPSVDVTPAGAAIVSTPTGEGVVEPLASEEENPYVTTSQTESTK
ncbi:MAG: pyridoxamine 5'-phosphate oxidase family protein, partial [Catalinimonas sp.]